MFSVFVYVSVSGEGEGRGSCCVNAVDHSDGEARASDFAPAMAVSVPARCMSQRCEGEAASSVCGCVWLQAWRPRHCSSCNSVAQHHVQQRMLWALPTKKQHRRAPVHIQAATCSRLQPVTGSCLARLVHPGQGGDGTAAAAAGSGRCIPPSTPNNTTANLYQSHHTPPKTINTETETEPKLGCAVAAGAVRCCGVALGFDSVQTFRAGPLAPSTSCNTRISRTQCHAHSQNVTFCPGCCPHLTQLAVRSSCARVHLPLRSSHCRRRTPPGT